MRVPKIDRFSNSSAIKRVTYSAPIIIPRHPVLTNERQRDKCTTRIEKKCRSSMEYRDLIKFLRTNMDMNQCEFLPNIRGKKRGSIEIHHAPFDLYSLVSILMKKYEKEHDDVVNEMMIAKEVMRCHYQGLIGLIPLSVTVHQLVHDGKLIVPLNCVYGRFVEFTQKYYEFIDDDLMAMLNENIELTKNLKPDDLSILNTCYIYSDTDGVKLPDMQSLSNADVIDVDVRSDGVSDVVKVAV